MKEINCIEIKDDTMKILILYDYTARNLSSSDMMKKAVELIQKEG